MTFGGLIKGINYTKVFRCNRVELAEGFLNAAGVLGERSDSAITKWIDRKTPDNITDYFLDGQANEPEVLKHIRRGTRDEWPKIQDKFRDVDKCYIDCTTTDKEEFCRSLLKQFVLSLGLLPQELDCDMRTPSINENKDSVGNAPTISEASISSDTQHEMSADQMRGLFARAVAHFDVMEIINRRPAILYRDDSASLNVFARRICDMLVLPYKEKHTDPMLYSAINSFWDKLNIQAVSITTILNRRFDFDDESAFINLEEDEIPVEPERAKRQIELPELTRELISQSADPLDIVERAHAEWGNFRNEMNLLYDEIYGRTK